MMTLYGYWRSSASYRLRIALNIKGVDYNYVPVNLVKGEQRSAAHLSRNAQGYVPVLELEDGTCLTQSLAVMDYLDATFDTPKFMPRDPILRSKILSAALIIAADTAPLQNASVLNHIKSEYTQDQEAALAWARKWIENGFSALETIAAERETAFLYTDNPAFFEICLVPQVYNARRFGVDMSAFPALLEIDSACRIRPEFANAAPENQIDAQQN